MAGDSTQDGPEYKLFRYPGMQFNNSTESNMRQRRFDDPPGTSILPGVHASLGTGPAPPMFPVHGPPPVHPAPTRPHADARASGNGELQRVRVRSSKACDRCRGQKVKCSGEQPCVNCTKNGKECVFSKLPDGTAKPVGRNLDTAVPVMYGTGAAAGSLPSDPSYVLHLENRVRYLELLLAPHLRSVTLPGIPTGELENSTTPVLNATTSKWRFLRRHQNRLLSDLTSGLYASLLDENRTQVALPRSQYFGWNMSGVRYVPLEPLPSAPHLAVPQLQLVDYFFRHVNSIFAIIHEPVFREQLVAYNQLAQEEAQQPGTESSMRFNHARLFLAQLHLIYALSTRLDEFLKPAGPAEAALKNEIAAFQYGYAVVNLLLFEWELFELLQAWLLITVYLRITHRQTSSYMALNRATTMCRLMGLGHNYMVHDHSMPYEQLKAKRIFWAVFTIERVFGLHSGRYGALPVEHVRRAFPGWDYAAEDDTWLPKPAFALLHVARIATFVHTADDDDVDLIKYQQVEKELTDMETWFAENEFGDSDLFAKSRHLDHLGLAMAQVKLQFYDMILCVHGRVLFDYLGKRIVNEGLRIERVISACAGIVDVLERVHRAKLLFVPWYSTLLLLFTVGVISLVLINGGQKAAQAKSMFRSVIRLTTVLQKAAVHDDHGKLVTRHRFTMARECLWALKMASRTLSLRLQQDFNDLNSIGVDHGSSDVNKQHFSQIGIADEDQGEGLSSQQGTASPHDKFHPRYAPQTSGNAPIPDINITPDSNSSGVVDENLHLGSLQWFDQWIDFNYDL